MSGDRASRGRVGVPTVLSVLRDVVRASSAAMRLGSAACVPVRVRDLVRAPEAAC